MELVASSAYTINSHVVLQTTAKYVLVVDVRRHHILLSADSSCCLLIAPSLKHTPQATALSHASITFSSFCLLSVGARILLS